MTVIVNTRDLGEIRVTQGQSWRTESDHPNAMLDVLDGEGHTIATFRDWQSVHATHEESGYAKYIDALRALTDDAKSLTDHLTVVLAKHPH